MDMQQVKIYNIVKKTLKKIRPILLNNDDKLLEYSHSIIKDKQDDYDDNTIGNLIKFVFVGGYDAYNRPMPYMIRIILFSCFTLSDYSIKKLTIDEIKNINTKIIYDDWISQKIIKYGPPGPGYHRTEISKVKVKVEVEEL